MEEELGAGNKKPEVLAKLAQYELTLTGSRLIRDTESMLQSPVSAGLHSRHSSDSFPAMLTHV